MDRRRHASIRSARRGIPGALLALALIALAPHALRAGGWWSWRGPEQRGISRETDLPATWSPEGENLLWKAPYGSRSAPVVNLDRVYLSGVVGEGANEQERLVCLDAATGELKWESRFNVFLTDIPDTRVGWANPVADPSTGYVYVHGVQGLLRCYDHTGELVWERSLTEEFGRISGYGGRTHTPLIDEDRLVISFLSSSWGGHGRGSHRYLALDKRTGAVVWWSNPSGPPYDTTYSCPVVTVIDGRRVLIAGNADGSVHGLEARTGEPLWRFRLSKRGLNVSVVERDGMVYAGHSEENVDTGTMGRVVCFSARDAAGDITETHEAWRLDGITCGYSTPALDDRFLYAIDNTANVHSIDARTGKLQWKKSVGTVMKASPVVADGKLYVGSVNGTFSILELGEDGAKTTSSVDFVMDDGRVVELNGSPCVSGGRVYFATSQALYCLGKSPWRGITGDSPPASEELPVAEGAKPARLRVVPAEVAVLPGQRALLDVRAFDDHGRLLATPEGVSWSLEGVRGTVDGRGRLAVLPGGTFQGGVATARVGDLSAACRVRVVPRLPLRIDFEDEPVGGVPGGWVGATPVKFRVVEKDGSKVLTKLADRPKFMLAKLYFGLPAWRSYTLQADVLGTEKRRQLPDIGILAQRYNLCLMGNDESLRIVAWAPMPRIEEKVDFVWDPDTWYRMKLRVDHRGETALVRAKVWPREEKEPTAWTLTVTDPCPNTGGSPGLHGYSAGVTDRSTGTEIFWDNILVTANDGE